MSENTVEQAVFSVIRSRRSVRRFKGEPVPRAILEKIVAAGVEAPSGCNMQFRHYLIVDDPAILDQIRSFSKPLGTAPAVIVILMEPKGTRYGEFWIQDASAAMENMLLATVALGYAACWVEGAIRRCEQDLKRILRVPDELRLWSLLPVGRGAETPKRPPKPKAADITRYNTYASK